MIAEKQRKDSFHGNMLAIYGCKACQQTFLKEEKCSCMPVTPALGGQSQENCEFEASLGYIANKAMLTNKQTKIIARKNKQTNEINFMGKPNISE